MTIDQKELEIIAVAISYTAGCVPCTKHHIDQCIELGATPTEINHSLRVAATINEESRSIIESKFGAYFPRRREVTGLSQDPSWHEVFIGIGCAVARNNPRLLRFLIKVARQKSASDTDLMQTIALARSIMAMAQSHVEALIDKLEGNNEVAQAAARLCQ